MMFDPYNTTEGDELEDILATLVHTYLAKITKPANATELDAYNKKVDKLLQVSQSKLLAWRDKGVAEARLQEISYIDVIFSEYDSKRQVWSVIQSHIRNRKAQLSKPVESDGEKEER